MVAQTKAQQPKPRDPETVRVTWEQLLKMLKAATGKKGVHILVTHKGHGYLPRMSNDDFCQVEGVPIVTFASVPEVLAAARMLLIANGTPLLFPALNNFDEVLT